MTREQGVEEHVAGVLAGDRRAIAKAITLIESRHPADAGPAEELLEALLPRTGGSIRLGITGAPGVGKSCFVEALGLRLIEQGTRVAVLAIDPSSTLSGGSILGDKTRMARLAQAQAAFVRPSPSGGALGGVARRTRESVLVCEAAGFGVVIVETVGVGQSETDVADMVDFFAVLLQPAAGDELQGIKKGVVELADALVVNKADGELKSAAETSRAQYEGALALLRGTRGSAWSPLVLTASAHSGAGIDAFWETVLAQREALRSSGELERRRRAQLRSWLWRLLRDGLEQALRSDPAAAAELCELEQKVAAGVATPPRAARTLLENFLYRSRSG
jgi:LAO/AO transport system kinase